MTEPSRAALSPGLLGRGRVGRHGEDRPRRHSVGLRVEDGRRERLLRERRRGRHDGRQAPGARRVEGEGGFRRPARDHTREVPSARGRVQDDAPSRDRGRERRDASPAGIRGPGAAGAQDRREARGRSKLVRAEGVTPYTRGRLVDLPRSAPWREAFVSEMANFPVGRHDYLVDSFVWAVKAFMSGSEFRKPGPFALRPGPRPSGREAELARVAEEMEMRRTLSPDLDEADAPCIQAFGGWG